MHTSKFFPAIKTNDRQRVLDLESTMDTSEFPSLPYGLLSNEGYKLEGSWRGENGITFCNKRMPGNKFFMKMARCDFWHGRREIQKKVEIYYLERASWVSTFLLNQLGRHKRGFTLFSLRKGPMGWNRVNVKAKATERPRPIHLYHLSTDILLLLANVQMHVF